jgi:hypothetical protein
VLRGLVRWAAPSVGIAGVVAVTGHAGAEATRRDLTSIFYIAKSENRNQVHYAMHLDTSCSPVGQAPIEAYWRMLERGPRATEPLLSREVSAYGFAEQRLVERGPGGGRVYLRLQALPARPIVVETSAGRGGDCEAVARTIIAGVPAGLTQVFVQLRWPFGVEYVLLSGHALADGHPVQERLSP